MVVEVGLDQFAIRAIQRYFVGLFTFFGGNVSIGSALLQRLEIVSRPIAIISAQLLRQSAGGLFQRLQRGRNFLFIVGVLADMLSHNDLQVGIDANLGM